MYRQQDDRIERKRHGVRKTSSFFGLINKAEYLFALRDWTLVPRWKSEFQRRMPLRASQAKRRELTQLFMLIGRKPVMRNSYLEAGLEYELFSQLEAPVPPGAQESLKGMTTTFQVVNLSDYLGYQLTTALGFETRWLNFDKSADETRTRAFITMHAGVER